MVVTVNRRKVLYENVSELMRAAAKGDQYRCLVLLNEGEDPFAVDANGRTALDWARICQNIDIVHLLQSEMEMVISEQRKSATTVAEQYLEKAIAINRQYRIRALQALESNDVALLGTLTAQAAVRKADLVDVLSEEPYFGEVEAGNHMTPLLLACGAGDTEVVRQLVHLGVDMDYETEQGQTALTWSCVCGQADVVDLLIDLGAQVEYVTKLESRTLLHFACMHAKAFLVGRLLDRLQVRFVRWAQQAFRKKKSVSMFGYYAQRFEEVVYHRDRAGNRAWDLLPHAVPETSDPEEILRLRGLDRETLASRATTARTATATTATAGTTPSSTAQSQRASSATEVAQAAAAAAAAAEADSTLPASRAAQSTDARIDDTDATRSTTSTATTNSGVQLQQPVDGAADHPETIIEERRLSMQEQMAQQVHMRQQRREEHADALEDYKPGPAETAALAARTYERESIERLFELSRQRVQQWQLLYARDMKHAAAIPCWHECGFSDTWENVLSHASTQCPLRPVGCPKCLHTLQAKDLEHHLNMICAKRLIACRNVPRGCLAMVKAEDETRHAFHECACREVECRLGCGERLNYVHRPNHELSRCPLRTVRCEACGEDLHARDMMGHRANHCPLRLVLCPVGCTQRIPAKDLDHHINTICIQPCRWNCGERIGPKDRRTVHERMDCAQRTVRCRLGCGVQGLIAMVQAEHERFQCSMSRMDCPSGCGARIERHLVPAHLDAWRGTCPERYTRCPLDVVGKRIMVNRQYGKVLLYERDTNEHLVRFSDGHRTVCLTETLVVMVDDIQWDCGWVPHKQLATHLNELCVHRSTMLKEQRIPAAHYDEFAERRAEFEEFTKAPPAKVACAYCASDIRSDRTEEHLRDECTHAPNRCPLGCGATIPRILLETHVSDQCPKREIPCKLCSCMVWAEEEERHVAHECPERNVLCPNNCGDDVHAQSLETHLQQECKMRIVVCACTEHIVAKDLPLHELVDCAVKLTYCPLGCGEKIPRRDLEAHQRDDCPRKDLYQRKLVNCPLDCGVRLMRIQLTEHLSFECARRILECPFGCREVIRRTQLQFHTRICTHRQVPCQPFNDECTKYLKEWFTTDEAGRDVLTACTDHEGTILHYAVRTGELELVEYVMQRTRARGVDADDVIGDNPLCLACAAGSLPMVKLLVEWGADVNIETRTGKTPLIESVKGKSRECLEYLVSRGCLVRYKTVNHQKTAWDWAHKLSYHQIKRSLEVSALVEEQVTRLFVAINTGDKDTVMEMIEDGDFYTPDATQRLASQFHDWDDDLHETDLGIKEIWAEYSEKENLMKDLENRQRELGDVLEHVVQRTNESEDRVASLVEVVTRAFTRAGLKLADITDGDLEEIVQQKRPDLITRGVVLCVAIAFGTVSPEEVEEDSALSMAETRKWWPKAIAPFHERAELVHRIQFFNRRSMHKDALARINRILKQIRPMMEAHRAEMAQAAAAEEVLGTTSSVLLRTGQGRSQGSTRVWQVGERENKLPTAALTGEGAAGAPATSGAGIRPGSTRPGTADRPETAGSDLTSYRASTAGSIHRPLTAQSETASNRPSTAQSESRPGTTAEEGQQGAGEPGDAVVAKERKNEEQVEEQGSNSQDETATQVLDEESSSLVQEMSESLSGIGGEQPQQQQAGEGSGQGEVKAAKTKEQKKKEKKDEEDDRTVSDFALVDTLYAFCQALSVNFRQARKIEKQRARTDACNAKQFQTQQRYETVKQQLFIEKSRFKVIDDEVKLMRRKQSRMRERVALQQNKLRVAKLLNIVTSSGHTALTWACASGAFEIADELMTHGGAIGFTEELMHLSAELIQHAYRRYRQLSGNPTAQAHVSSLAYLFHLDKQIKSLRQKIPLLKRGHRMVIAETIYGGHIDILERVVERGLFHRGFAFTWRYPQGSIPYAPIENKHVSDGTPLSAPEVGLHALSDMGCDFYDPDAPGGWVPMGHEADRHQLCLHVVQTQWDQLARARRMFHERRERVSMMREEADRLSILERKMDIAIRDAKFHDVIDLVVQGADIDYETKGGHTALIVAAEENVSGVFHKWMVNDDHNQVLAVEFLLDRPQYRPSIDQENAMGHTALTVACSLGRLNVVESLLDRGSAIDRPNKDGMTPLMFCAASGNAESARMLLERGADSTLRNCKGQSAMDMAELLGFSDVTAIIRSFTNGVLGIVKRKRGVVDATVSCPWGCGQYMFDHEVEEHFKVCVYREVECPFGCGIKEMLERERQQHQENDCPLRQVKCDLCDTLVVSKSLEHHKARACKKRTIRCPRQCGESIVADHEPQHAIFCKKRLIQCPDECGEQFVADHLFTHQKDECIMRRVSCPQGCGSTVVFRFLEMHVTQVCPCMPMVCRWCHRSFERRSLKKHTKSCELRQEPCRAKCGALVRASSMEEHMVTECPNRIVDCTEKCGLKVRLADMEAHHRLECTVALIPCAECEQGVRRDLMPTHLQRECPHRLIDCAQCGEPVQAGYMEHHKKEQCERRVIQCRNTGCYKMLPLAELIEHEKNDCKKRLVYCLQGCGLQLFAGKRHGHMEHHCPMRYVDCSIGCGTKVRASELADHIQYACEKQAELEAEAAAAEQAAAEAARREAELAKYRPRRESTSAAS